MSPSSLIAERPKFCSSMSKTNFLTSYHQLLRDLTYYQTYQYISNLITNSLPLWPNDRNKILHGMINDALMLEGDAIFVNDEEIASFINYCRNDTSNTTDTSSNDDDYPCLSKVILMEMN